VYPNLDNQMVWMHGSIFGCIYRNSGKQATAMYVILRYWKHPLRSIYESFMFWSKNHFCVKIWFIVTVVWRLLAELAKIWKIWHCQSHRSNCWSHGITDRTWTNSTNILTRFCAFEEKKYFTFIFTFLRFAIFLNSAKSLTV
jgi:hypothetical protein